MPRISLVIITIIIISFLVSFGALANEEASSSDTAVSEEEGGFGITFFRGWDDEDKTLFVTSEILLIADWGQSLDINRKGLSDGNPILNKAPLSTVNTYFAAWLVANYFITDNLSGSDRKLWLNVIASLEVYVIGSNYAAGINIAF